MGSSDKGPFLTLGLSESEAIQSEPTLDLPEQIAEWKLEPELACTIPRQIVMRKGMISPLAFLLGITGGVVVVLGGLLFVKSSLPLGNYVVLGFLGVVLVLYSGMLIYASVQDRRFFKSLVSRGVATRGTVVRVEAVENSEGGEAYNCVVAYGTPERHGLTMKGYRKFEVGDTLTVLYLPEAPQKAMTYSACDYKAVASPEERST